MMISYDTESPTDRELFVKEISCYHPPSEKAELLQWFYALPKKPIETKPKSKGIWGAPRISDDVMFSW